jgi:type II secretory pathway predicted ATPase ExeA
VQIYSAAQPGNGVQVQGDSLLDTTINRYRTAVERLARSYFEGRPVGIVVSDGRLGRTHVVGQFLDLFQADTDISSISRPHTNATAFMQQIVSDFGFSTGELSLQDLEGVLELFLRHQGKKKRRTIIAVQDFDAHGWWVLDKIRRLIEFEAQEKTGLMLVLSGTPSSSTVLNEPILDVISTHAGERIVLAPFTLAETRDFVRRLVESSAAARSNGGDVGEMVEFFAVTLMHELCAGIPDDVHQVCSQCLTLIESQPGKTISVDVVKEAAALCGIGDPAGGQGLDAGDASEIDPDVDLLPVGSLLIKVYGEPPRELSLDQGKIIVGRDRLCEICVSGLRVSRFHALFSLDADGLVVADLSSTNGTRVNGQKIDRYTLADGDVVTIGMARITYAAGCELSASAPAEAGDDYELEDTLSPESSINYIGDTLKILGRT